MGRRIELGLASAIPRNDFRVFPLEAIDVVVYNVEGVFYAVSNYCPHQGVVISRGPLQGKIVTCPGHGYQFDVTTGQCLTDPELGLARFVLEREGDTLYLTF